MNQPEPANDPPADAAATPDSAPAAADPLARIAALEAELSRAKDQTLRALADAENTRKRGQRDREDAGKYAIASFAKDMLDFADNFHRALSAIPAELRNDERINGVIAGIEGMEKQIAATFERHGLVKIEPLGALFDANYHEVIFEAPAPGKPAGIIIQVVEPGYLLRDRLLRPARVGVAKGEDSGPGSRIDTKA